MLEYRFGEDSRQNIDFRIGYRKHLNLIYDLLLRDNAIVQLFGVVFAFYC